MNNLLKNRRGMLCLLLFVAGCALDEPSPVDMADMLPMPAVDLPVELREANWGLGSCAHASTVHLLRWQGQYALADWWRNNFSGGEYPSRLHQRLDDAGLRYAYTVDGDPAFLEWALRTRRGAGVTFWPQHAVNLVHLDGEVAGLLDNNQTERIVWIPREEFLRGWQSFGGWAWTLVYDPAPPTPYYCGD